MDKTEKYNIASIDIHGHGCDVTELKHVLPPEEFAIETASLFGLLSDSTRLRILYLLYHREVCVRNIAEAIEMSPTSSVSSSSLFEAIRCDHKQTNWERSSLYDRRHC